MRASSLRRLASWVKGAIVGTSLALSFGAAGAWLRSYWYMDDFQYSTVDASSARITTYRLTSSDAGISPLWSSGTISGPNDAIAKAIKMLTDQEHWQCASTPISQMVPAPSNYRFSLDTNRTHFPSQPPFIPYAVDGVTVSVGIPYWSLVLIFALLSSWAALGAFRRRYRIRRHMSGQCINCGFDLRASTERCPECGTPIPHRNLP